MGLIIDDTIEKQGYEVRRIERYGYDFLIEYGIFG